MRPRGWSSVDPGCSNGTGKDAGGTRCRCLLAAHRAQPKQPVPRSRDSRGAVQAVTPPAGCAQGPGARMDCSQIMGWRASQPRPAGRLPISQSAAGRQDLGADRRGLAGKVRRSEELRPQTRPAPCNLDTNLSDLALR
ncbi:hypothetical protein NDU88_003747 [Pleurodeles waltl]|uniref:Uncharacterized protein n=1 Tax=Pleurodeles waltl TaxID=8319 RepID=A0AAV7MSI7_PLEWA|nr:hypothetical protein NDU88_003747 [Pleurodeles waltl]